jgi:hypothetical protein
VFLSPLVAAIKKAYADNPRLPFQDTARAIYRRMRGDQNDLLRNFKAIHATKPLRCNPASRTEIHTLTCHKHVFMFLTAAKSLLRFESDVAAVVHDDGSLTDRDVATIKRHIEGISVIRRRDADVAMDNLLASFPKTRAYRSQVINSLELTDHLLLSTGEKVMITNSDTLFLRRPDDLLRWFESDGDEVLCVYEREPYQQADFLRRRQSSFPPHLTLALTCFRRDAVDPSGIEDLLNQVNDADDPWYIGQNSLPVLIGESVEPGRVRFLDKASYQASGVFGDGAIFRHYWTSLASLNTQYFSDATKVISDLKAMR